MKRVYIDRNEYEINTLKKDWIFYYPIFFSILLQRTGACLWGADTVVKYRIERDEKRC